MDTERPTLDIARELRAVAKPGGFLAELLAEAANRLELLHEELHQKDVQIAIREGERDGIRDELAVAVKLERGATEQVVALSEALAETRRERDTAREVARSNKAVTEGYAAELDRLRAGIAEPKPRPWPHPEAFDITPGVSCCCVEVEGDEFCPVHDPCCGDHSNLCGVADGPHEACCGYCPEFVEQVTP